MSEYGNGKDRASADGPFQVNLPVFDGPLDLLLQLVRKQQLDINELRLAELTEHYLEYVERIKEINLDQAGEFLTIASTLIWIKSKTLLPRDFQDEELDPETVEEMLLLRLQEYQKIKEAAHELSSLDLLGRDVFPRHAPPESQPSAGGEPEFEEVSLFALIEAFREVLERTEQDTSLHVIPERDRVEDRIRDMLALLADRKTVLFRELLAPLAERVAIILSFIALLELVRLKAVRVTQEFEGGEIMCHVTENFGEPGTDWISAVVGGLMGEEKSEVRPDAE